ncbi:MAG: tetratricopeptide repeat protein, partial [Cyanobacteria bacterium M_surface_7_m2_040]|nr:tetratricopeptide repeat protein [Cyanobacteria bacterium M_surface_7_m2_040]
MAALPDGSAFHALLPAVEARQAAGSSPYWTVARGFLHWRCHQHADALAAYQSVLLQLQHDCTFHLMRGMAARQLPDQQALALEAYQRARELDPLRADVHYNLGNLHREARPLEAEPCYRESLRLDPAQPMAWHNYGILLLHELRLPEAFRALRTSLRLDPRVAAVWCNLALALFADRRLQPARRALLEAIALDPNGPGMHPEQAMARWEQGGTISKDSIDALWDLALISLAAGEYPSGWRYYEIRFSTKNFEPNEVPTVGPRLRSLRDAPRGSDPALVVWSEQGLGDAIQFGRYLPILEAAGIPYEFRCRQPLLRLFREWFGLGDRAVAETHRTDPADLRPHCSLLSLPHLFGSDLTTLPCVTPYLTAPGPTPEHLKVPPPPGGLSVGVVWAANPKNKAMYSHKSIPLQLLMPRLVDLLELDLIDLHSLQFGDDRAQLDPWRQHERITDWSSRIDDFADTAHVIRQLDLVITVDTAVAHLAGALNRPTWLLLPRNCDFRWLLDRNDSPWYPRCL